MQTAQDIVAYLLASNGGGAQDGEHTAVRHAVLHGVREVMQCKDWNWHVKTGSFDTGMVSAKGSVTAGSNVINLLNTDGFVPGRIVDVNGFDAPTRIVSVHSGHIVVDRRAKSSSTNTDVKPQQYYDLPYDLKDLDTLATRTVGTLHCRISPQEWQRLEVNHRGSGEPYYYTVMRSDVNPDRYQIRFVGTPTNETRVSYTYRVIPKPIKYMGYEKICRQGTVQVTRPTTQAVVTAGSNTLTVSSTAGFEAGTEVSVTNFPTPVVKIVSVTGNSVVVNADAIADGSVVLVSTQIRVLGTNTNFPQDASGCFIRFGTGGMDADAIGSTVPFLMERRIESWASTTNIALSTTTVYQRRDAQGVALQPLIFDANEVITTSPSATPVEGSSANAYVTEDYDDVNTTLPALTKYAITDVINASPQMHTAILSACEMWYARMAGKDFGTAMQVFNRDLRLAMENDVVTPMSGNPLGYASPRTMGWHSDLGADIG